MQAGQRIGKYVLDDRIAIGGMAEVWAAHAEGPQGFVKRVALKFILESFAGDPELERLFVNEARIAAQLQNANLVTVFDFDKIAADQEPGLAGRYYIAMERVQGQDLRHIAEAAKRAGYLFPVGVALHLAGEVLKALRYIHEHREGGRALGLVHRDVSPHNVLVGYGGEVKLSDFGIAKARTHSARGTKTGTIRGKLSYASPEQLNGESVDHRTDQFALGVTLWEILAGRRLFDGNGEVEIIGKVLRCEVPPLAESSAGRSVPPAVEALLRRMLAPRRDDRFETAGQALTALLALPGYEADGSALGDLVRTLFLPSPVELPHTVPIVAAPPGAPGNVVTRTMAAAALAPVTAPPVALAQETKRAVTPSPTPPPAAIIDTEDVRTPARGRRALFVVAAAGALSAAGLLAARRSQAPATTTAEPPAAANPAPPPPPAEPPPAAQPEQPAAVAAVPPPPVPAPARAAPPAPPIHADASAHARHNPRGRHIVPGQPRREAAASSAAPANATEPAKAANPANGALILE